MESFFFIIRLSALTTARCSMMEKLLLGVAIETTLWFLKQIFSDVAAAVQETVSEIIMSSDKQSLIALSIVVAASGIVAYALPKICKFYDKKSAKKETHNFTFFLNFRLTLLPTFVGFANRYL